VVVNFHCRLRAPLMVLFYVELFLKVVDAVVQFCGNVVKPMIPLDTMIFSRFCEVYCLLKCSSGERRTWELQQRRRGEQEQR